MNQFDKQAAHLAQLAMTPGWWQYARHAAGALEADDSYHGMYSGLRAAVGAAIKAAGFKPAPHEIEEFK